MEITVNTAFFAGQQGNPKIEFGIPFNMAKDLLPQLKEGRVIRGWLGVMIQDVTSALQERFGLETTKGTVVSGVTARGPPDRAGIRRGDVIETSTRAGYYPDSGSITVKMLGEKGSGRLLGAQIVGKKGAAKRIDVIAAALHNRMAVEEMIHLDLSYAPPYATVWAPILIAARVLMKKL